MWSYTLQLNTRYAIPDGLWIAVDSPRMECAEVLIVEDQFVVAEDLRTMVEDCGHHVAGIVASGEAAIQLAKKLRPDLLLMDIRLRGRLNGVDTAINLQREMRKQTPVIFVSGSSLKDYPVVKKLSSFYSYLPKPVSFSALKNGIQQALKASKRIFPN